MRLIWRVAGKAAIWSRSGNKCRLAAWEPGTLFRQALHIASKSGSGRFAIHAWLEFSRNLRNDTGYFAAIPFFSSALSRQNNSNDLWHFPAASSPLINSLYHECALQSERKPFTKLFFFIILNLNGCHQSAVRLMAIWQKAGNFSSITYVTYANVTM